MAKVVKQKYTKSDGTRAIYSYLIPITKTKMELSSIDPDKPINIEVKNGKIIITN